MNNIIKMINKPINDIPEGINKIKESRNPLILYGNSEYAHRLMDKLNIMNIKIDGVCVSDEYLDKDSYFENFRILSLEETCDKYKKINIMVGFSSGIYIDLIYKIASNEAVDKIFIMDGINIKGIIKKNNPKIYLIDNYYEGIKRRGLNYQYLLENIHKFQQTYDMLEDDLSKKTFLQYLNGHISMLNFPMENLMVENQYFVKDIMKMNNDEILIDCGAYNGDSIQDFIENTGGAFSKIYALEPDPKMYNILNKYIKENKYQNIECFNIGAWNKEETLKFFNEACGSIENLHDNKGECIYIKVQTIDDIISNEKATFIKMDIEGAELNALKGSKKTIIENKPKLAICVYHKKEDLIEIPQFIKSLNPNYKIYLRAHWPNVSEVVIYAII